MTMETFDPQLRQEIEADLRAQLERVRDQMQSLTRRQQRAALLKEIYGLDPLTRERFNELHGDLDQFPGKIAELREEERLLAAWLERSQNLKAS
jgi:predicted  nucleic acid-binding Zn-ribbon protein